MPFQFTFIMNHHYSLQTVDSRIRRAFAIFAVMLAVIQLPALALQAPTEAIAVRVEKAKKIFLAEVINRVEKDGWVRAELLVKEAVFGVEKDEKVKVIWRKPSQNPLLADGVTFDVAEGAVGVALLGDQHEGRFWLRDDRFEPVTKLDPIKKLAAGRAVPPAEKGQPEK